MVKLGPNKFEFSFYNDEDESQTVYSFEIVASTDIELLFLSAIDNGESDVFDEVSDKLENEYGVHDISFNPDTDFYGYTSYEVESSKHLELMNKWREFFIKCKFDVSPIKLDS